MQERNGISQRELCDLLGLDYKAVAASAKEQGISTHAYLQQETGWILKDELYYPPDTETETETAQNKAKSPSRRKKWVEILGFVCVGIALVAAITFVNKVGIEQIRANVDKLGIWAPIALLLLRTVSVVIPAIPSTAYSVLSGTLFGFWKGIIVIFIADFAACCLNFYIAKRFGRKIVQRFVGERFIDKVDNLASKHLEDNIFLVAGFLMTGLFDFVCYAVGLTEMPWRKFIPALILGIVVSTPPIVALGAGVFTQGKWMLVLAMLGMFGLAIVTGWLNKKRSQN
ncbi:TVP38/TMEM64 family protein [Calothrix sp. CCY 0018]|uniref:TVP38/TMEM64 family protein n=1 Tax=Calothrix sp. CCY 0018 TaxID=3103864 RepID=UPI0039C6E92A